MIPMRCASRSARGLPAAIILGTLAACSTPGNEPPGGPAGVAPTAAASAAAPPAAEAAVVVRPHARWIAATWAELPGWESDRSAEVWGPLLRSCEHPAPGWAGVCAEARADPLVPALGDGAARQWLEQRLRPYRVETPEGGTLGLATGYFEPLVEATRVPRGGYRYPLYAPPADLATRKPYWTRREIDSPGAARRSLRGREIAWLRDPLDALVLHIQGSGRLVFTAADGTRTTVRVAFAGHNDQPYRSVGRWLIEQGDLRPDQASWPAIRAWARQNPKRLEEMLWSNPRYVFFREEPLPDPAIGPKGAQGVPLTPGRSIAVDPLSIPYGTVVWLDTSEPLSTTPLRRLVVAQDTGSAITGAVRADYFWGWDDDAEARAGRMKQPLRLWVLWPR